MRSIRLFLGLLVTLCVPSIFVQEASANSFVDASLAVDCDKYTLTLSGVLRTDQDGFSVTYTIFIDNGSGVTEVSGGLPIVNNIGVFDAVVMNPWPASLTGTVEISAVVRLFRDDNGTPVEQDSTNVTADPASLVCEEVPPPPGGDDGCTPGYWKQPHHLDSWEGYSPNQLFSSVFDNAFPGKSLLEVLWLQGGGLNALGRHTVAALLNSASSGVDFELATAAVIGEFNAVYPGSRSSYLGQKDDFADLNEQRCPLN